MKKLIAMTLALVLLLGLMPMTASAEDKYAEHYEYTIWIPATPLTAAYYQDFGENPVVKYLNERFNVTLHFQQPASGSEMDAINLIMGTQDYPDMMDLSYYTGSVPKLVEDGVALDLTPYIDEYMPNYKTFIDNETYHRKLVEDDGSIYKLMRFTHHVEMSNDLTYWGGLVYRTDILEMMTGGNVAFPSGKDYPATIEDYEYALPLYKAYFDAASAYMPESAPLILPFKGFFDTGEIVSAFGVGPTYYIKEDNLTVGYGPLEDGFRAYVERMHDWYEKGYIYKDFMSRTSDLFYLPNTSLTYGGAAGMWFGLLGQMKDKMSMPEYGLDMYVMNMPAPGSSEYGVEEPRVFLDNASFAPFILFNKCEHPERLLEVMDFLYSAEAGPMLVMGLSDEQVNGDEFYVSHDLPEGAYSMQEDGSVIGKGYLRDDYEGDVPYSDITEAIACLRLPGAILSLKDLTDPKPEIDQLINDRWGMYEPVGNYPGTASMTYEEDSAYNARQTGIDDYVASAVPKFITGATELNDETWAAFVNRLKELGAEENLAIRQAGYDRYLQR